MKKMKIKNHRKKEMKNKINGNRRNKNEKNAPTYTSSLMFALQVPCWLLLLLHGPSCSLLPAPQETWWPPIPTKRTWWPNIIQEPWSAGDTMLTGQMRWFTMFVCSTRNEVVLRDEGTTGRLRWPEIYGHVGGYGLPWTCDGLKHWM